MRFINQLATGRENKPCTKIEVDFKKVKETQLHHLPTGPNPGALASIPNKQATSLW